MTKKHPIQPLEIDCNGTLRFKENKIVRYLLDNGGIDLNTLEGIDFPDDDRAQFTQLIGYSHGGCMGFACISDELWESALAMYRDPKLTEQQARIQNLRTKLSSVSDSIKRAAAEVFAIHPDDLQVRGEDE